MTKNRLIFLIASAGFVGLTVYALWKEVSRGTVQLQYSISGVILSGPGARGIVKTDNAHVLLFDPETFELVASKILNPFYRLQHLVSVRMTQVNRSAALIACLYSPTKMGTQIFLQLEKSLGFYLSP